MQPVYEAGKADGADISRLLESPVDAGLIQAIYTRRPDAYESYMKESGESRVFVLKRENRVVATCAELIRDVYVRGEVKRSAYFCGLKRDPAYQGLIPAGAGFFNALQRQDIDFYYCAVLANNRDVMEKFGKKRSIFSFRPVASYTSYILNPNIRTREEPNAYVFRQAAAGDAAAIVEFLNAQGRGKDLFPYVRSLEDYHGLRAEDFYLLEDGRGIKACAAVWNVSSYKQFTVKKYRGILKGARVFNPLLSLLGYAQLPRENEPMDLPTLAFFLSRDDSEDGYRILFHHIKNEIKKRYSMFLVGLPAQHVIASVLKRLPKVTLESVIYEVRFSGRDGEKAPVIDPARIYTESALL
jgi:hypothetical protein